MSMRQAEAAILREARELTGKGRLRQKDIVEWSTGPIQKREGETQFTLPKAGVTIAISAVALGTAKPAPPQAEGEKFFTASGLTKLQQGLLLYIECRCVDHYGTIDGRNINDEEREQLEKWAEEKFIVYQRIGSHWVSRGFGTCVKLSEEAWRLAHMIRRERGARMLAERWFKTTDELREQKPAAVE